MPRCHAIQTRNAKINAKFSHLYTQYSEHIADGLHHLNSIGFTCVFISNLELIFVLFACVGAFVCSCIPLMNKKRNKQINRIKLFTQFTVDVLESSFFAWYLNSNAVKVSLPYFASSFPFSFYLFEFFPVQVWSAACRTCIYMHMYMCAWIWS